MRVLNLPVEMFRESVIQTIASCIGDPIKIDGNTFTASRGKYARFCVQVPINKTLERGIRSRGRLYQVVYENLPSPCYKCGRIEHSDGSCEESKMSKENDSTTENSGEKVALHPTPVTDHWLMDKAKNNEFGDWMEVPRQRNLPKDKRQENLNSRGKGKEPVAKENSTQFRKQIILPNKNSPMSSTFHPGKSVDTPKIFKRKMDLTGNDW